MIYGAITLYGVPVPRQLMPHIHLMISINYSLDYNSMTTHWPQI